MKIMVVGSGGREHAIAWKLSQSPRAPELYCAPGNAGMAQIAQCVPIGTEDLNALCDFAHDEAIDLVIVGPDAPLAMGLVDMLEDRGIRAFGPRKNAAIIESSKSFSKNLMKKYNIPTARYEVFSTSIAALDYVEKAACPIVIKADGLALGKGVIIAQNSDEARQAIRSIMVDKIFGESGDQVIIEEYLTGQEISVLAFTDGETLIPMVSAQDHKRALDGDNGPNTGGMGAFSPSRIYDAAMASECETNIFLPTIRAMAAEGRPFRGVLYFGLMSTAQGVKVIEYNARFGDPETQAVLPRLKTDLLDIMEAVVDERLDRINIEWWEDAAVCVVAASGGYPGKYALGYPITGLDAEGVLIFHAGTRQKKGKIVTSGGRVLGITALHKDLDGAVKKAYEAASTIHFQDMYYRSDIGVSNTG